MSVCSCIVEVCVNLLPPLPKWVKQPVLHANPEARIVFLDFGKTYGTWYGRTTLSELMEYPADKCPLSLPECALAWHKSRLVVSA